MDNKDKNTQAGIILYSEGKKVAYQFMLTKINQWEGDIPDKELIVHMKDMCRDMIQTIDSELLDENGQWRQFLNFS